MTVWYGGSVEVCGVAAGVGVLSPVLNFSWTEFQGTAEVWAQLVWLQVCISIYLQVVLFHWPDQHVTSTVLHGAIVVPTTSKTWHLAYEQQSRAKMIFDYISLLSVYFFGVDFLTKLIGDQLNVQNLIIRFSFIQIPVNTEFLVSKFINTTHAKRMRI